jgi:hypothetical protein
MQTEYQRWHAETFPEAGYTDLVTAPIQPLPEPGTAEHQAYLDSVRASAVQPSRRAILRKVPR